MKKDYKRVFVLPLDTIRKTIEIIDKAAIGIALVVDEEERLLGTVTDGDIRRGILRGIDLEEAVEKVMNPHPVTGGVSTKKEELFDMMREKVIKQIPIVNGDSKVIGLELLDEWIRKGKDKENPAVILAGGLGTRLRPLTDKTPKPLIQVGDKLIIELIIEQLSSHGFKNIFVCVHYKAEEIKERLGSGQGLGVRIDYLEEDKLTGTAGPLRLLKGRVNDAFIVVNGDLLTKVNFENLVNFHTNSRFDLTVGIKKYSFQVPYGVIKTDGERLSALEEKPSQEVFVNAGIYVLNPDVLELIPEDEYYDMTTLVGKLLEEGKNIGSFPVHEYWLDIGEKNDLERAYKDYSELF